jgi:hypothetical protein
MNSFISNFLKHKQLDLFVFFLILLFLSLVQIYILEKDYVFSIFHSALISSLVSIS